jgi:ribosomal-protein-alanine N-acetyltransferase
MSLLLPERLHTARLVLRAPRPEDAARIFAAYTQDSEVARHMVWRPHTSLDQTAAFIAWCIETWTAGRGRPYLLAHCEDEAAPIGMLEARLLGNIVDIGYVLQRASWGAGLMTEAMDAASKAALDQPDCYRVQATCDTQNHASARVLEKSGFVREGQLERHAILPNLGPEPRASLMFARCRQARRLHLRQRHLSAVGVVRQQGDQARQVGFEPVQGRFIETREGVRQHAGERQRRALQQFVGRRQGAQGHAAPVEAFARGRDQAAPAQGAHQVAGGGLVDVERARQFGHADAGRLRDHGQGP